MPMAANVSCPVRTLLSTSMHLIQHAFKPMSIKFNTIDGYHPNVAYNPPLVLYYVYFIIYHLNHNWKSSARLLYFLLRIGFIQTCVPVQLGTNH